MRPRVLAAGAILALGCAGGAAQAQINGSVVAESDYRYRGVSLSESRPSARITVNWDGPAGWYAGGSTAAAASGTRNPGYAEIQVYAGRVWRLDSGHSIEAGLIHLHLPRLQDYDNTEAYVGLLAERWNLRLNYAPNYFGRDARTFYLDGGAHGLLTAAVRLFAHVGLLVPSSGADDGGSAENTRTDLRVGIGRTWRDFDVQLAWVEASRGGPYPAVYGGRRGAALFSVSLSF